MRIKICGLTRPEDVRLALDLGATHLGFVLAPDSPRCVKPSRVRALLEDVPDEIPSVLVFRNARVTEVLRAVSTTGVHRVQLHETSPEVERTLEGMGCSLHRVARVRPTDRHLPVLDPTPGYAHPWVLDVGLGGSGRRFDWSLLRGRGPRFCFVAGGIAPENAPLLCEQLPWGVDLSSGVESSPGVKDPERMRRLFDALNGTCTP